MSMYTCCIECTMQDLAVHTRPHDTAGSLPLLTLSLLLLSSPDNPTTERTGCITAYTIGVVNDKNTQLGAKVSVSNVITNPIKHTMYAAAGTPHTIQ